MIIQAERDTVKELEQEQRERKQFEEQVEQERKQLVEQVGHLTSQLEQERTEKKQYQDQLTASVQECDQLKQEIARFQANANSSVNRNQLQEEEYKLTLADLNNMNTIGNPALLAPSYMQLHLMNTMRDELYRQDPIAVDNVGPSVIELNCMNTVDDDHLPELSDWEMQLLNPFSD